MNRDHSNRERRSTIVGVFSPVEGSKGLTTGHLSTSKHAVTISRIWLEVFRPTVLMAPRSDPGCNLHNVILRGWVPKIVERKVSYFLHVVDERQTAHIPSTTSRSLHRSRFRYDRTCLCVNVVVHPLWTRWNNRCLQVFDIAIVRLLSIASCSRCAPMRRAHVGCSRRFCRLTKARLQAARF